MMMIFRRDLRLGAISIAAVFSHMSFDIFLTGETKFPLFVPFATDMVTFGGNYWMLFEGLAVGIIFVASAIFLRKQKIKISG